MRISRDDNAILREEHQRECTFKLQQRVAQRPGQRSFTRVRDQMQHDFGVAIGLEIAPCSSNSRRSSSAFVIFPLCATAISPLLQATENGWAFRIAVSPAVEYRV